MFTVSNIILDTLKEILREIDNKLSEEDLDGIIEEVDEDGSGTLDFDGNVNIKLNFLNFLHFRIHGDDDWLKENYFEFK